jgi:hypothetical protein
MTNTIEKRKEFEEFRLPDFGLKFSPPCIYIVNHEYPFEAGDIVYSEEISFDGVHTWQGYPATASSYMNGKSVLERHLLQFYPPGEHSVSLKLYITDGRIITSTRRAIVVDDGTVLWIYDLLNEDESLFNTESGDVLIQE